MTGHKFPFMGAIDSIGDYYEGYGFLCSIALSMIAVILWIIPGENACSGPARRLSFIIAVGLAICATYEWIYFFPFCSTI
ncbi:MAG TPA: hypothetical protein VGI43_00345 [Mucilaginibacter sp.]